MAQYQTHEAKKEKSFSPLSFMVVFGVIGVILVCIYSWWVMSYEGNWTYLTQVPPDVKQIIPGANGVIYIQNQNSQLFSCNPWVKEECWIPDALPDHLPEFQNCSERQPAFMFFSKPPQDIISCFQYDELYADGSSFNILALNQNGEFWGWDHQSSAMMFLLIPPFVLVAGLLGMILGGIIWVANPLRNQLTRKLGISKKNVLLLIPWMLLAPIIAVCIYAFYPSFRSKTPPEQSSIYTAIAGTLETDMSARATVISVQVPRGTESPGYELIALSCQARWEVGFHEVVCPDDALHKESPFIVQPGDYSLRGGDLTAAALVMPVGSESKFMEAIFPRLNIQNNDHFRSTVGCLDIGDACNVYFEVSYLSDQGSPITLGRANPKIGIPTQVDLDLSHLAGKAVNIRIYVYTHRDYENQYPSWVNPVIGP